MKHIIALLLAAAFPIVGMAAGSYLDNISVSPYAAVTHHNITDGESWGAGLDVGLGINPYVSIHALNVTYSDNDWRSSAIDETSVLVKARLIRNASETLSLYGLAGGDRQWTSDDWAFGAGLGIELRVSKHVSVTADTRIRSWFNAEEDLQTRAALNIRF